MVLTIGPTNSDGSRTAFRGVVLYDRSNGRYRLFEIKGQQAALRYERDFGTTHQQAELYVHSSLFDSDAGTAEDIVLLFVDKWHDGYVTMYAYNAAGQRIDVDGCPLIAGNPTPCNHVLLEGAFHQVTSTSKNFGLPKPADPNAGVFPSFDKRGAWHPHMLPNTMTLSLEGAVVAQIPLTGNSELRPFSLFKDNDGITRLLDGAPEPLLATFQVAAVDQILRRQSQLYFTEGTFSEQYNKDEGVAHQPYEKGTSGAVYLGARCASERKFRFKRVFGGIQFDRPSGGPGL